MKKQAGRKYSDRNWRRELAGYRIRIETQTGIQ
jgi:hypothetical protein